LQRTFAANWQMSKAGPVAANKYAKSGDNDKEQLEMPDA